MAVDDIFLMFTKEAKYIITQGLSASLCVF